MIKKIIFNMALALLVSLPAMADEIRYQFDENQPGGTIDLATWRSSLRGMNQMDMMALRPRAKRVIDGMEYGTDAAAQSQYAGTGVTITKQAVSGTFVQEGSYSLKAVIDVTNNRSFSRSLSVNLSAFQKITLWTRAGVSNSAIQFYLSDGTNSSYWDLTTDASAGTWKQHTITLSAPDSNSGSAANLAAITSYGYRLLDNGVTYYFDTIKAVAGMTVIVQGTDLGSYYRHVYIGNQPLSVNAQSAPTISVPISNPRIDILTINSSGVLSWVVGTESSTPVAPSSSVSSDKIPIAEVYMKTTMTKVVDFEDKDANPNEGYIQRDIRPWLALPFSPRKGADIASASSITLGNDGTFFDITGTTTITSIAAKPAGTVVWLQFDGALTVTDGSNLKLGGNFVTAAESTLTLVSDGTNWFELARAPIGNSFIGRTDTPSSYSGQAYKLLRVNSGATAVEFVAPSSLAENSVEENTSTHKFRLVGDTASPGAGKVYGTSSSGARGWYGANSCQEFTSSGSYTASTTRVFITGVGGGGGGAGGCTGGVTAGGGAGQAIINFPYTTVPGNSYTVTIGPGGSAAIPCGPGGVGGTTSFGSLNLLGGQGGNATGGNSGSVIDGDGTVAAGVFGIMTGKGGTPSAGINGGGGGASPFGSGADPKTSNGPGNSAGNNTGAGGGAGNVSGNDGGAGGSGYLIVCK